MFFSVITKNINWEILTKNLVTFKRWEGVKSELWGFIEISNFRGFYEKPIYWGDCLGKKGLDSFQI